MKTTIAFFDASPSDREFYPAALGPDVTTIFVSEPLDDTTVSQAVAAHIISTRTGSTVSAAVMKQLPELRHVACRTTGFDHVDLKYTADHHITVSNVPSYGENTVAEYAFMLLLAVARRLPATTTAVEHGPVDPQSLMGHDIAGKTLGVIGTGRIGRHVAQIGRGFGLKVLGYDLYPQPEAAETIGFQYAPLDEVLAASDYLSLHAPATPETHHLLNAQTLAKTKPGVIIVNTARGTLIDTPALIDALTSGHVGGAGLDVIEGEDFLRLQSQMHLLDKPDLGEAGRQVLGLDILLKLPNAIITSHNAYNTAEALERIRQIALANIQGFIAGQPSNLVAHE